jgi:kynurenine formamidase
MNQEIEVRDQTGQYTDSDNEIRAYGTSLRRWGLWGPDDEKGALNFITPAHRVRAAALVRTGKTFHLGLPLKSGVGPQFGHVGRFNPMHLMTHTGDTKGPVDLGTGVDFTDDMLAMPVQCSTQWDALCHIYYDKTLYNGFPSSCVTAYGADRAGIDKVSADFIGRGVLLDVAAHMQVDVLEEGYQITSEDLEATATHCGVEIADGDILIVRTGAMSVVDGDDWSRFNARTAGLNYRTAEWLGDHRIAAVASDTNAVEAPSPLAGIMNPLHMVALRDMGIHLGELWYLEDLAADCREDSVYEFLLVAQALKIVGGTGSPLNPIAMK